MVRDDLVSIIVPLHNDENNISYCLNSLIAQTYKNIEIIIVENGSTDNGCTICKEYVQRENRIRLLVADRLGVSNARNIALDIAKGKYVFFCDSDDCMKVDMIEKLVSVFKKNNSQIVVCGYERIDEHKKFENINGKVKEIEIWDNTTFAEHMFLDNSIRGAVWNKGFSKEIIGSIRFDTSLTYCEDFHFIMQILSESKFCKICYLQESLYYYYANPNSVTKDRNGTVDEYGNSKYVQAFKKMLLLNFSEEIKKLISASIFRDSISALLFQGKKILDYSENVLIEDARMRWSDYFKDRRISCFQKIKMCVKVLIVVLKFSM